MKKILLQLSAAIALSVAISIEINAQPVLDNTFSGDGYLLKKVSQGGDDIARTVLIQNNGRLLTGGNSFNTIGYSNINIMRIYPNGSMDNTFGTAGIASIPGGFFCDMSLLPSGKIIVAGSGVGPTNNNNYMVYRMTKTGVLDTTFGNGGSVKVNMPNKNMICFDVVIQPDGKILLGGYADDGYGGHHNMVIVRLKANGSPDNTFATGGKFTFIQSNKSSECKQLALQPDGKIVAAGFIDTLMFYSFYRYDFGAVRLNINGTLDNTFGVGGVIRADKADTDIASAVSILSDGRIVLGGNSNYLGNNRFAALCLLSNGSFDTSFGTGGWSFFNFYGGSSGCNAIVIEPDDDIIMAGVAYIYSGASYQTIALAKLLSNGTPDNTFGDNGIDTSFYGITTEGCNDIALQSDNKIVIAGYSYAGTHSSYLIARYTNSAALMKQPELLIAKEFDLISQSSPNKVEPVKNNTTVEMKVYPTLSSDIITLELNTSSEKYAVQLTISDVAGKSVFAERSINQEGFLTKQIDISKYQPGIYFIKAEIANEIYTSKIIKQ